jgi:hypothetical protein
VEAANDYVVGDPNQRKPARPIGAAEQIHSTKDRYKTDQAYPYNVVLKWMVRLELSDVVSKPDYTRRYQKATNDGYREWTFDHWLWLFVMFLPGASMVF